MAAPRKLWSQLKPDTQKRKLRFYEKQGISPASVRARYNAGTLGPQKAARGHARTPEHGLGEARRKPAEYPEYLRKRRGGGGGRPPQAERERWRDRAFMNIVRKLGPGRPQGQYAKYNGNTVWNNVYGGQTSESGKVPGMTTAQAKWTAEAEEDELVERAYPQYRGNPWYYH